MRSLMVSGNARYLTRPDGRPFLYLGDTAWELFHRLTREEADHYLKRRAEQRFTVIQAVVLAEGDGLRVANAYGEVPLRDMDPTRPNERYFEHVDYVVRKGASLNLFTGMLPTWGDKVGPKLWGVGPEVFTPEKAQAYGRFLGGRYREQPVIWVLGGDRPAEAEETRAIWRAMARGIREGDGGRHLMTYHPWGGSSSSRWLHGEQWLDFNMLQSGHGAKDLPNYEMVAADRALAPRKPTMDGEARYEDHPVDWKPEKGWFDDFDVRQAAYWGVLAGACGHTYGCHDVWQFWQQGREPISHARTDWREALELPGGRQMRYLRALCESRPYHMLAPDQSLIVEGQGEGADHVQAARAEDGSFLLAYLPTGGRVVVDTGRLASERTEGRWFCPRTGEWERIGEYTGREPREFMPPSSGRGNDWVLVLDDRARASGCRE